MTTIPDHAEAILRAATPIAWLYRNSLGHACIQFVQGLMGDGWTEEPVYTNEAILAAVREAVGGEWRDVAIKLHQALVMYTSEGCPYCSGDCGSANPPVFNCPTKIAAEAYRAFDALPTPPAR